MKTSPVHHHNNHLTARFANGYTVTITSGGDSEKHYVLRENNKKEYTWYGDDQWDLCLGHGSWPNSDTH